MFTESLKSNLIQAESSKIKPTTTKIVREVVNKPRKYRDAVIQTINLSFQFNFS